MRCELSITTKRDSELVDITDKIETALAAADIKEGILIVYVPHTTAAVLLNENADPSVAADIISTLDILIPKRHKIYSHLEGNSAAHIKAALIGQSKVLIIKDKRLYLGRWQGVFLAEFDGPRERKIILEIKTL